MSANIDQINGKNALMLFNLPAWHGLGNVVDRKLTKIDAIVAAYCNFLVVKRPVYFPDQDGNPLLYDKQFVLTRDVDNRPLGLCSDRYQIDQNIDGFDWAEQLLEKDVTFESVGCLFGGKLVFLLAHTPEVLILNDSFKPYLLISVWHDGQTSSSVTFTSTRVVCQNTWNAAMSGAANKYSYKHTGNLDEKRKLAFDVLGLSEKYTDRLAMAAASLVSTKIDRPTYLDIINEVWPEKEDAAPRETTNRLKVLQQFANATIVDDLKPYRGTAWCIAQAAAAFDSHAEPSRKMENWKENRFVNLMNGGTIQDSFLKAIEKVCGVTA